METVYVIMESNSLGNCDPVAVFANLDDASAFYREKNRNTCHTLYIVEVPFNKSK